MTAEKSERRGFRLVCPPKDGSLVEELLRAQGFAFDSEPFSPLARRLTREPFPLGASLAAKFGRIYIQDRSSMLPPLLLDPPVGATVLDMCAAPGSKTGLLAQLVGEEGFVLGLEPSPDRLTTLRANLARMGMARTATAHAQSERVSLPSGSFTHIMLDPPCSGWGTENKHPNIKELWAGERIDPLIRLQRELLTRAADLLAPGGRVIYSTCTTNVAENEEQVLWAAGELDLEPVALEPPEGFVFENPRLPGAAGSLRVSEDSDGQGFYLAGFRKPGQDEAPECDRAEAPGRVLDSAKLTVPEALEWDRLPPGVLSEFGGKVFFLHARALELMPGGLRWQGVPLGRVSGQGRRGGKLAAEVFRPDPLGRALLPRAPGGGCVDVAEAGDLEGLLAGRSLTGPAGSGPVGLFFRGLGLGWLARKGNRMLWSGR